MKILQKLFGETKMQVKESTGEELQARLAEIDAGLRGGSDDAEALIEERERVQRRLEAARLKKAHDDDVAYKAKLHAKSEEYRARLMPVAVAVADLTPRYWWCLSQLQELDKESFASEGEVWAETNIPHGLAATVLAAIREASQQIEWHYDFVGNPNATNPLPTPKIRKQLMIQAGPTDIHGNRVNDDGTPASYRLPAGIAWLPPAR